jgi:hypothetical protein
VVYAERVDGIEHNESNGEANAFADRRWFEGRFRETIGDVRVGCKFDERLKRIIKQFLKMKG